MTPASLLVLALVACGDDKAVSHDTGGSETRDVDADGFVSAEDCDDTDPDVHPGAEEPCNGADDDCSGTADDGTVYADADGDGFGDASAPVTGRSCPDSGESKRSDDCDDTDPAAYPGAEGEVCEGADLDCDGVQAACMESSAAWFIQSVVPELSGFMGAGASLVGDVDGDGISDLLLGGSDPKIDVGRVRVFRANGLDAAFGTVEAPLADWILEGPESGYASGLVRDSCFGATFLPDMDGDGRSDILVGASGVSSAYLVPASALGEEQELDLEDVSTSVLSDPADPDASAGRAVSAGGDVDGDGVQDVLVGGEGVLWVVPGPQLGPRDVDLAAAVRIEESTPSDGEFATDPTRAGDLDGDGLDDVLVNCYGCTQWSDYPGAVYLFSGAALAAGVTVDDRDADVTLVGPYHGWIGEAVLGAADLDGDGRDDWVTSAQSVTEDGEDGAILLWYDTPWTGTTLATEDASARLEDANGFGHTGNALSAGDFDGDGAPDLAVEDYYPELDIYVLANAVIPRAGSDSLGAATVVYAPEEPDRWGHGALRMDGDLDADGLDDLLIADPYWDPEGYDGDYGGALVILGH